MMETIELDSGLLAHVLTAEERSQIWAEVSKDINPAGKDVELYTPQDKRGYKILAEREVGFEKYEATILANNKKIKVRYTCLTQHSKIYKAVRAAYS